jgi:hypothetical protein
VDVGDAITGMNMTSIGTSISSTETDGTAMSGMPASNQTVEMATTGMHSMNHSVDISIGGTMDHRISSKIYQSHFGTSPESQQQDFKTH